jgi:hypothetical protein
LSVEQEHEERRENGGVTVVAPDLCSARSHEALWVFVVIHFWTRLGEIGRRPRPGVTVKQGLFRQSTSRATAFE